MILGFTNKLRISAEFIRDYEGALLHAYAHRDVLLRERDRHAYDHVHASVVLQVLHQS